MAAKRLLEHSNGYLYSIQRADTFDRRVRHLRWRVRKWYDGEGTYGAYRSWSTDRKTVARMILDCRKPGQITGLSRMEMLVFND